MQLRYDLHSFLGWKIKTEKVGCTKYTSISHSGFLLNANAASFSSYSRDLVIMKFSSNNHSTFLASYDEALNSWKIPFQYDFIYQTFNNLYSNI